MSKARRGRFPVPTANEGHQGLPMRPGTVIGRVPLDAVRGTEELTETEHVLVREAMAAPVDAAPSSVKITDDLQDQVATVVAKAADHSHLNPIDPSTPAIDPPEPVDVDTLPPAERAEALRVFQEMDELQDSMTAKRQAAKHKRMAAKRAMMAKPGAAAAVAVATAAAEAERERDVPAPPAAADAPPAPPFKLKEKGPDPVDEEPEAPQTDGFDAGPIEGAGGDLAGTTVNCPRCNHDLNGELVTPTNEDVAAYLAAIMGEARFRKEINLFGGRVKVVFRGLLPREVDMALQLADQEMANGKIQHIMQYVRIAETYKMAMGVESVTRAGQGPVTLPEVDAIDVDEGESPILALKEYIDNDICTTDSLRRAISSQWVQFNQVLQYMEAKAEDPDFFDRTA